MQPTTLFTCSRCESKQKALKNFKLQKMVLCIQFNCYAVHINSLLQDYGFHLFHQTTRNSHLSHDISHMLTSFPVSSVPSAGLDCVVTVSLSPVLLQI